MTREFFPTRHIKKRQIDELRAEIAKVGLALHSAQGDAQLEMLPKVLRYLGPRGLGTLEGQGLGYMRIATRIQDLEAMGFTIFVDREHVVSDDGLLHPRMARYILIAEPPAAPAIKPQATQPNLI